MSTRSVIARQTAPGKFAGVYHHWDGYPDGLGATLHEIYNGHFKRDAKAMLAFLIDAHPAGWSTINNGDFTQPAGFDGEGGFKTTGPKCYCHGGRKEDANPLTHENASDCGCEYAYVFAPKGKTMTVLSSMHNGGGKMIGMFGCGAPGASVYWKVIGVVDLDAPAPDWQRMGEVSNEEI